MLRFTPLGIGGTISLINYSFYSWKTSFRCTESVDVPIKACYLCDRRRMILQGFWAYSLFLTVLLAIWLQLTPRNCLFGALAGFLCLRLYSRLNWVLFLLRMYLTAFVQIIYFLLLKFFSMLGCSGYSFPLCACLLLFVFESSQDHSVVTRAMYCTCWTRFLFAFAKL